LSFGIFDANHAPDRRLTQQPLCIETTIVQNTLTEARFEDRFEDRFAVTQTSTPPCPIALPAGLIQIDTRARSHAFVRRRAPRSRFWAKFLIRLLLMRSQARTIRLMIAALNL
jgi:hypothetical protein